MGLTVEPLAPTYARRSVRRRPRHRASRRNGVVSAAALTTPHGLCVIPGGEFTTQEVGRLRRTAGPACGAIDKAEVGNRQEIVVSSHERRFFYSVRAPQTRIPEMCHRRRFLRFLAAAIPYAAATPVAKAAPTTKTTTPILLSSLRRNPSSALFACATMIP